MKVFLTVTFTLLVLLPVYLYNYMLFSPINCKWSSPTSNKVVLVADPQLDGDVRVLSQGLYGQFHNEFNDWYYWHIQQNINRFLSPNLEFILGDVFSVQYTDTVEFKKRKARFDTIFDTNSTCTLVSLVGNHDTGFGGEVDLAKHRYWRFIAHFGKQDGVIERDGHILAYFNSLTLDNKGSDNAKDLETTWNHLRSLRNSKKPVILFTHLPLYKPDGSCKKNYSLTRMEDGTGLVLHQTMLSPETSQFILNEVKPKFVFTGHDHYGCHYKHSSSPEKTEEYTVRSVMGDFAGNVALFEFETLKDGKYEYHVKQCTFFYTKAVLLYMASAILWALFSIVYIPYKLCCCFARRGKKEKRD